MTNKSNKKIEIYTTSYCPFCKRAKELLDRKKVSYTEINVENPSDRELMIKRTNGAKTVPQIFIDDNFIEGGCDGLYKREEAGELDKLLC